MSLFVVDVEADGPIPHEYSMVCFGAVIVRPGLSETFYGKTKPVSSKWKPDALAISGISREDHLKFDDPFVVMTNFDEWIKTNNRSGAAVFASDNIAFDWQWINYYFHYYLGKNPFGYSGRRIGDLYCGMVKDSHAKWKHLRGQYPHDHNPVNDAKGNANAILEMQKMGLKINLK